METLQEIWAVGWAAALIVAIGSFVAAWVFERVILSVLSGLASRTQTTLDDVVIEQLRRPVYVSLLMIGFDWSVRRWNPPGDTVEHVSRAVFYTVAIVLWGVALHRLSGVTLKEVAKRSKNVGIVQDRTLPLFDIVARSTVLAGAIYLGMVAWHIDVGAWLASAGVLGIAAGFAAQDSLANYFAGIFIIADAPYKLHDVITLDDGTRGQVIDIGLRSTRIHTMDGVEINIPNSVLGNMKIENRSGGPAIEERISIEVGVAYGSDVDRVIETLSKTVAQVPHVLEARPPEVRFKSFGASSLDFDVKVWIHPDDFEDVRHELHVRIYKALAAEEIEIPFPQQDLYVKELPGEAA